MRLKLEIAGGVLLVALLALVVVEEIHKYKANFEAEARAQIAQESEKKVQAVLDSLDKQKKQLDDKQAQQDKALSKMTTPQIVVKLPEYVPQATSPAKVLDANSAAVKAGEAKTGDVLVPQEDVHAVAQKLLDGQQCSDQLGLCQQKLGATENQLTLKTEEAKQWEKAAKGGSVMKRVGKVVLAVGLGVAIGYAAHH